MKCSECGADIFEGIPRCPFCKTPTSAIKDNKFKNFDFTYTITSKEQIKAIRDTVAAVSDDNSKLSSRKISFVKKSHRKRSSRNRKFRLGKLNRKKAFGIAALCVAVLCVIAVIWGVVSLISFIAQGNSFAHSYTYYKDNSLYLIYNNDTVKLSHNAICDDYLRRAADDASLPSSGKVLDSIDIAHNSQNGTVTYFFDDFNPETQSGRLNVIKNGKEKSISVIADEVHNSIVISKDGNSVLFLRNTDQNGDMGVLYYWKPDMKEPHKISSDIDPNTFVFSADDDEVLFIQNLVRASMQGDLYSQNLKKLKDKKLKIDNDVCYIFGTDNKGDNYIYAKSYDTSNNSFEIYTCAKKPNSDKIRLGERTKFKPHMLKKKNYMFVYGLNDDGANNLYYVNIKNGDKEKIATDVNRIYKISDDEKYVMYDKVYNGTTADYYIYTVGKQSKKVAENVNINPTDVGDTQQLAVSDDLSNIVYISGFDARTGSGRLFIAKFKSGKLSKSEQVSDDVHSCHMTKKGNIIYTKDYSLSRKVFDVYVYRKNSSQIIKDELSPDLFEVSKSGDTIFYTSGLNTDSNIGDFKRSSIDGKSEKISEDVFAFDQTALGDIFFFKNPNPENGRFDLYLLRNGKTKATHIDDEIDGLMPY